MVHMTDLYEATTGERAYNAHNGKDFSHANAMQLLAHEATNGRIAPQNLAAFERAHIAERFQAIEAGIASLTPAATVHASNAQQHSLQLTPATSLA